jgi:hypothetical protein
VLHAWGMHSMQPSILARLSPCSTTGSFRHTCTHASTLALACSYPRPFPPLPALQLKYESGEKVLKVNLVVVDSDGQVCVVNATALFRSCAGLCTRTPSESTNSLRAAALTLPLLGHAQVVAPSQGSQEQKLKELLGNTVRTMTRLIAEAVSEAKGRNGEA